MPQGCHARIIQPYGLRGSRETLGGRSREVGPSPGAGTADTLAARNLQVSLERLVQANAEEIEAASLPGSEANDPQATALPAAQLFAPVFSIGTAPLLNALLYRNSPGQLAGQESPSDRSAVADKVFAQLADNVDAFSAQAE
jgi:hypothetical protein